MARDNSRALVQLQLVLLALDGARPAGTLEWVSAAAPVVTQAAVGAGHWAAGRRQRALAAWASAAGSGLAAWGGAQIVFGVRSGLRHPRQLTAHVIASETFSTASYVLVAARAVQRRRPRIAAGRALSAAGSLARLRAASAEPLQ